MNDVFRIDAANIMHEIIDGEVVVVNLDNGTYYSLDAVGADVWSLLEGGRTQAALVDAVAARYVGERDTIAAGVEAFLRRLQDEKLITVSVGTAAGAPAPPAGIAAAAAGTYSDPVLQKYTDMEELLLVDPIHEVEESGWPDVK